MWSPARLRIRGKYELDSVSRAPARGGTSTSDGCRRNTITRFILRQLRSLHWKGELSVVHHCAHQCIDVMCMCVFFSGFGRSNLFLLAQQMQKQIRQDYARMFPDLFESCERLGITPRSVVAVVLFCSCFASVHPRPPSQCVFYRRVPMGYRHCVVSICFRQTWWCGEHPVAVTAAVSFVVIYLAFSA
jgi:hypothetical protein